MFKDMRAVQVNPTKKGFSVRVRTYHPITNPSIWVPIPSRVVDIQTKAKLRYRNIESGYAARFRKGGSFSKDLAIPGYFPTGLAQRVINPI